ncbi:MAG TPA: hypothetical protein VHE78_07115 [Gemmatimonadaceae bacterium]|nr:hypothetical protein [Gemmatimonadaceae bacterium]
MASSLKERLRRLLLPSRVLRDLTAIQLNQGRILSELNASKPVSRLNDCEFEVFSQFGEDGIIQRLVRHLPVKHHTFIEFGVEDFSEANCRFLMMNDNWRGYVLDGSARQVEKLRKWEQFWRYDLRARCAFVTRENVNDLLGASGFAQDLGILSIDVDGMDYWVLEAIEAVRPRILIVEYNALFGADRLITVPYDAQFSRVRAHSSALYFGASLGAIAAAATRKGLALVATESSGTNAFFVREDLLGNGLDALPVRAAYHGSLARQSRDAQGKLDYLDRAGRMAAIRGMPVMNVETGAVEPL